MKADRYEVKFEGGRYDTVVWAPGRIINRSQDVTASREIRERGREMRQNVRRLNLPLFET